MPNATGETGEPPQVAFDHRLELGFHGAKITSDGGLLAHRELDGALGLTAVAASTLAEGWRGKNVRHRLLGLLRQAVYGRPAGYEDVNAAGRFARDPALRYRGAASDEGRTMRQGWWSPPEAPGHNRGTVPHRSRCPSSRPRRGI